MSWLHKDLINFEVAIVFKLTELSRSFQRRKYLDSNYLKKTANWMSLVLHLEKCIRENYAQKNPWDLNEKRKVKWNSEFFFYTCYCYKSTSEASKQIQNNKNAEVSAKNRYIKVWSIYVGAGITITARINY